MKFLLTDASTTSLSVTVTGKLPVEFGVPVIRPLVKPMESPGGSPDAVQEYGGVPPAPSIVNEYVVPRSPESSAEVWMRRGPPCARSSDAERNANISVANESRAAFE